MGDLCIPEIHMEQYANRLLRNEGGKRIPLSGSLEITFRCNNRCVHCYVNKAPNDQEEKAKELTCEEISRLLDKIAQEGCLSLLITGGETLIREDFGEIYLYAKRKGFLVTVFTNGTLITPSIADLFSEFPPRSVEITLYGVTEKTYENVTQCEGSYQRCKEGIGLLVARRIPLRLKTMVLKANKHEFFGIKNFAKDLGVDFRFDALINERLDRARRVRRLRISPYEVVELDLTDPKRKRGFVEFFERTRRVRPDPESLFHCGAGVHSFHVDPYGRLMCCMMVRSPSYDLRNGGFRQGWHEFLPTVVKKKSEKGSPCQDCDLIHVCDQCPGWSQLEHGDPEVPVDYLCQVTHLRAEAFGVGGYGSLGDQRVGLVH